MRRAVALLLALALAPVPLAAQTPPAIFTDPAPDAAHPAGMAVLHIPSGGVEINGVAYLASGAGPHPTLMIAHGLPGNEKNLDLAQAVRRAGWNAVTFNYRGSWGSPGKFRFAQNPEDAAAVLAYLRAPENAKKLGIDTSRIVLAGHSMGGWVTALTAARDPALRGAIVISAANMGASGYIARDALVARMADNLESLNGTDAATMSDELIANRTAFDFMAVAPKLTQMPMLVLSSDDGLSAMTDTLVAGVRKAGGTKVTATHVATDHSWSGARIRLQTEVLNWLAALK